MCIYVYKPCQENLPLRKCSSLPPQLYILKTKLKRFQVHFRTDSLLSEHNKKIPLPYEKMLCKFNTI